MAKLSDLTFELVFMTDKPMPKLSYQQIECVLRAALQEAHPYDPDAGTYPWIKDVYDDVVVYEFNSKLYRRTYRIDGDSKAKLSDEQEVIEERNYEPVVTTSEFALFSESEEYEVWRGKIFEAGDYPDKDFNMSEEELKAAEARFKPFDIDLEHIDTVLNKKLGRGTKLYAQGKELFAEVQIPKWLSKVLGKSVKVSASWDRSTKTLLGLALCRNPRISDAQLVAAFTLSGEGKPDTNNGGAAPSKPAQKSGGQKDMTLTKRLAALFGRPSDDFDPSKLSYEGEGLKQDFKESEDEVKEPDTQTAAFAKEVQAMRLARLNDLAEAFANEAIAKGKALPAQKDSLVALFKAAAQADSLNESLVHFDSDTGQLKEGTSIAALRKLIQDQPVNELTGEKGKSYFAVENGDEDSAQVEKWRTAMGGKK